MVKKVACEKCIKAYRLPEKLLGKDREMCWWCCSVIIDLEKLENKKEGIKKAIVKI